MKDLYRVGIYLDEWIETEFHEVFEMKMACNGKNQVQNILDRLYIAISLFLQDNQNPILGDGIPVDARYPATDSKQPKEDGGESE